MNINIEIAVFLIVVIVMLTMLNCKEYTTTIIMAGAFLLGIILTIGNSKELLEFTREPNNKVITKAPAEFTNDVAKSANIIDDTHLSRYGNISVMNDIDKLSHRNADMEYNNISDLYDNSDIIDSVIHNHSSTFQPNHAQGVTPTTSAYHSNFKLAEPGRTDVDNLEYMTPLNDKAISADEALARKQQHRASINKRAIDGAVRTTKNKFQRIFQDELDENEEREWWSAESTKFETDFNHYY